MNAMLLKEQVVHPVTRESHPEALTGVLAPLFTPERPDGRIDFKGIEAQADALCSEDSVRGLIVRSGPGRMWSYSIEEVRDAARVVLDVAKGRRGVIVNAAGHWDGTAADLPRPAVFRKQSTDLAEWAVASGAVAAMLPVPTPLQLSNEYPPQDVASRYFEDIALATDVPILIYNPTDLPVGCSLSPSTIARLSHRRGIVGVLYNTSDLAVLAELPRICAKGFVVGTANDSVAASAFLSGACATAGPLSALVPEVPGFVWEALHEADLHGAWQGQRDLLAIQELLAPFRIWDIACPLLHRAGIGMSPRSRDGGRTPLPEELELAAGALQRIRLTYH